MQGKSVEPPQGAMTDTPAPFLALADAWAKMEAAQLALDALVPRYSGRAGAIPWCEHFEGISVEWQGLEMCKKAVELSLIFTVERTSAQDDTKGKAKRSVVVKPVHPPMVDLPTQEMSKGNLPTAPAAPTLTLAGWCLFQTPARPPTEMTRLSLHLALQVAEGAWNNTTSGGLSLKRKLYPLARKGSMAEIAKARLLGAEIDTHISITLDAIDLDTSSNDILHTPAQGPAVRGNSHPLGLWEG